MLLIHPPVAKPCEPPAGISRLAGVLTGSGFPCTVLDANLEGILCLLSREIPTRGDTWTSRAQRNVRRNLSALRSADIYGNLDRYKRAVTDLNRLLSKSAFSLTGTLSPARVSLANVQHPVLSPVRSSDLLRAAETPEEDPFHFYFSQRLRELVEKKAPSIVGVSLSFLSQALCTFAVLGFLRKEFPDLKLVLGGGLVTSWMRRPGWTNPFGGLIDHLVPGPGEGPLLSLLTTGSPLGKAVSEQHHLPDTAGFPLSDYLAPRRILPYSASTGCYWNQCAFCPERAEGNVYTPTPVPQVVEDLRRLVDRVKPGLIHLLDNALSPALMKALCENPPGTPWYGFTRITPRLADLDYCRALRKSGCVMLKLGLESGDQNVLDLEQKGVDLTIASRALRTLHQAGIPTYVYLLFGTPSEGPAEAAKTLQFTADHSGQISFLNLAIFNLPVYGPEASQVETRLLYDGDLSLYTGFTHPKGWDRGLVRRFLDREFKRHPAIGPILRRDPPVFTSNHAPFLCGSFPLT